MNTCNQLTANGVNDETAATTPGTGSNIWGTGRYCNNAVTYKEVYSPENLNTAIKGPYTFNVTPTENLWALSMFYIGPELPSLPEYEEIEKKASPETGYEGKYIQIKWQATAFHSSLAYEFYITRENLAEKQFPNGKLNIMGEDLNGLASFSDPYDHGSISPPVVFNIPLFALHRALSMGPNAAMNQKWGKTGLYSLGKMPNIFHGFFLECL